MENDKLSNDRHVLPISIINSIIYSDHYNSLIKVIDLDDK